jgi:predicted 2-oxoglutarate/Fe(II)-dependent dioxygenase YbiX
MHKELVAGHEDIFVIRGFYSPTECKEAIARSEDCGFGDAPVNSLGGPVVDKNMRNNERVVIDDLALAEHIWERLRPFAAEQRGPHWFACGLNERFRFYRYDANQRFDWHYDGCYRRSPKEQSEFTFMIYLNEGFEGGETEFEIEFGEPTLRVVPETGMALVFFHGVMHQGSPVISGRKYVLRSDIMFRLKESG